MKLNAYISGKVSEVLAEFDRDPLRRGALEEIDEAKGGRIMHALDNVILELAPTLRKLLFFSSIVRDRIWQWCEEENHGPDLLRRLGQQMALGVSTRLGRKGARLPITTVLWEVKEAVKPELRQLRDFLRTKQAQQKRAMNEETLLSLVSAELNQKNCPYPELRTNQKAFANFIQSKKGTLMRLVQVGGRISVASFIDEWVAFETNRTPGSVRKLISEVAKPKRRSPQLPT